MSDVAQPTKVVSDFEASLEKADKSVASFESHSGGGLLENVRGFLHSYPTAIPVFVLLLSIALFGYTAGEKFYTANNLSLVLQQVTVIGIIAIAQTIVILTAGIDLSVGAIMVLSSIVMGKLAVHSGVPVPLAVLIGGFAGAAMGYLNGTFVTRLRLPPFIVTLGTLYIFSALKIWYSNSESIRAVDTEAVAPMLIFFGNTIALGGAKVTYGGIAFALLAILHLVRPQSHRLGPPRVRRW